MRPAHSRPCAGGGSADATPFIRDSSRRRLLFFTNDCSLNIAECSCLCYNGHGWCKRLPFSSIFTHHPLGWWGFLFPFLTFGSVTGELAMNPLHRPVTRRGREAGLLVGLAPVMGDQGSRVGNAGRLISIIGDTVPPCAEQRPRNSEPTAPVVHRDGREGGGAGRMGALTKPRHRAALLQQANYLLN